MSLMNIQLRHIRAFIAVATAKSFARAAVKLTVSQPALSQTIIQFEQSIGFPLFERTTRSVELTKNGAVLLDKALALSELLDSFHASVKSMQHSIQSELRVGFLIGTGVQFIPAIIREFERRRPSTTLRLMEFDFTNPSAGLDGNTVDCSIFRPPISVDDVNIIELAREKCVVSLPSGHPLTARETVKVEDILEEPIVAAPGSNIWRDYWLANAHRAGKPAKIALEAATVETELQAVATGKGISITAQSTANYYARPGVVFRTLVDMEECVIAIGYREPASRLLKDFINIARETADLANPTH